MRNRFILTIASLSVVLGFSQISSAQNKPFNPRDLSGYWVMSPAGRRPASIGNNRPSFTPAGQAKFLATVTGFGNRELGHTTTPKQEDWNDPILWCDPSGFPRTIWFTAGGMGNYRFVQTPTELIQFFERDHIFRDLWSDGRTLPNNPKAKWFGSSTGKWEGDTFVVTSSGFDGSTWIDQFGSPHSEEMRLEERYRLVDRDHLEMQFILTDPKIYTAPWVGEKKILNRVETSDRVQPGLWGSKADGTPYGDIREDLCLYSEQESFFKRIDAEGNDGRLSIQKDK
jgi:hypothetical protein